MWLCHGVQVDIDVGVSWHTGRYRCGCVVVYR